MLVRGLDSLSSYVYIRKFRLPMLLRVRQATLIHQHSDPYMILTHLTCNMRVQIVPEEDDTFL